LLSGAGLMVRSYFVSQSINSFIPHDKVFTVRVSLPFKEGERYEEDQTRLDFYDSLLARLKTIPGVIDAAAASNPPGLGASDRRFEIEGHPQLVVSEAPQLSFVVQTTDYLSTIGLPILRGERFDDFISKEGTQVAVVTNEFAQHYWPEESGVGKRFRMFDDGEAQPWITVIGVCADLDQDPGESDFRPLVFLPHRQKIWSGMALVIRSSGDAVALARRCVKPSKRSIRTYLSSKLERCKKRLKDSSGFSRSLARFSSLLRRWDW
jgi:hypothetical protein